ncbi:hypothetical protein LCGC14_2296280, partial [marine sediment metagenome]
MGIQLTIKTPDSGKINRLLRNVTPAINTRIWNRGLTQIILEMQTEVTTSGKHIVHGRGDAPPLPNVLTSRHGGSGLVGSITPDYSGLPRLASLGSDLPYAGVHEDSKRAYLLPTYDDMARRDRLAEIMIGVIQE